MIKNISTSFFDNDLQEPFYKPFLLHMESNTPADAEAKELIARHCKLVKFAKGRRLLNIGNVCKFIYFIISGESISYHTDLNGKTTTWFFHFNEPQSTVKNLFAVDYTSFLAGTPATISIETLSPVTAIRFSVNDVQKLKNGSKAIEQWLHQLNQRAYMQTYDRITTLLTLSATDRYKKFLANEPHLLNMFSNYLIATYLNVTPQSLSRIRKNMTCSSL